MVGFKIKVNYGHADFVMHQYYENIEDVPIDILLLVPKSESLQLSRVEIDYVLEDGTVRNIVTKVDETSNQEIVLETEQMSSL